MGERQRLNVGARAISIAPQEQELRDLFDRKAKVACATDEAKALRVRRAVISVASIRTISFGYQANLFVVANHLRRDAGQLGCLTNIHHSLLLVN
jgi:hypothetical protein